MITTIVFEISDVFFIQPEELKRKLWQCLGLADVDAADEILYRSELWYNYKCGTITEEEYWVKCIERLPFEYKGSWSTLSRLFELTVWVDTELVELVRMLKRDYRIHVLANSGRELERRIKHFGIDDLFETVMSSHNLKMAKPDANIYHYTCETIEARPEEILFVENNYYNARVAKEMGFQTLVYTSAQSFQRYIINAINNNNRLRTKQG